MKFLAAPLAALPLMFASAQAADLDEAPEIIVEEGGLYVGTRYGLTWADDTSFELGALGVSRVRNAFADTPGFNSTLAVGTHLGDFRVEAEIGAWTTDVETHTASLTAGGTLGFPEADATGMVGVATGMVSAYWDLTIGQVRPFAGAGIGVGYVVANDFGARSLAGAVPNGVLLDDRAFGLAYHGTVGLGVEVAEGVTLELGYRYQAVHAELMAVTGAQTDFEVDSHTMFFGARVSF